MQKIRTDKKSLARKIVGFSLAAGGVIGMFGFGLPLLPRILGHNTLSLVGLIGGLLFSIGLVFIGGFIRYKGKNEH